MLKMVDLPPVEEREQRMDDWLAGAWMTPGFRSYVAYRKEELKKELASGIGGHPEPRVAYLIRFGQQYEALALGTFAKLAWERKERQKRISLAKEQPLPTRERQQGPQPVK